MTICNIVSAGVGYWAGSRACQHYTSSGRTDSTNELTSNWANAPLVELGIGSQGPGVTRLQHLLTDLGYYDIGEIDGIFGDSTLKALQQFQQDQKSLLESKLGNTSRDKAGFKDYKTLNILGGAMAIDLPEERVSEHTAALLSNPIDSGALDQDLVDEFGRYSTEQLVNIVKQALTANPESPFIKVNGFEVDPYGTVGLLEMAVEELYNSDFDAEEWETGDPLIDATFAAIGGSVYGGWDEPSFELRMKKMLENGHAGVGHRLSYKEAIWLWQNGNGTEITVDARAFDTLEVAGRLMADPHYGVTIDDLRVHGHVSLDENGELNPGDYDFFPRWMSYDDTDEFGIDSLVSDLIVTARNILNQVAIFQNEEGTPYLINYSYDDEDFYKGVTFPE